MNVKYDTDTNETSVGGVNERLNVETVVCPGKNTVWYKQRTTLF